MNVKNRITGAAKKEAQDLNECTLIQNKTKIVNTKTNPSIFSFPSSPFLLLSPPCHAITGFPLVTRKITMTTGKPFVFQFESLPDVTINRKAMCTMPKLVCNAVSKTQLCKRECSTKFE